MPGPGRRSRAPRRSRFRTPTTSRPRPTATQRGVERARSSPASRTRAKFSDKEQVWADNAESSPFFGNVYVCYAALPRQRRAAARNQPLDVITSTRRRRHMDQKQVTPAANNIHSQQRLRTLGLHRAHRLATASCTCSTTSSRSIRRRPAAGTDPDDHVDRRRPALVAAASTSRRRSTLCNNFEPSIGRCVEDGVGGARDDLGPAPSRRHRQRRADRLGRDRPDRDDLGRRPRWHEQRARDVHVLDERRRERGRRRGRSRGPVTAATTRRRRSRRTGPTSISCTTRWLDAVP